MAYSTLEIQIAHIFTTLENNPKAKQVIKYCRPDFIIKGTIHGKRDKRSRGISVLVTYGKPNYAERNFIKKAENNGARFPLRMFISKHGR